MGANFIPSREANLVAYGLNFKTRIAQAPAAVGLSASQATAFAAVYDAFVTAYNVTQSDATRTPASLVTKDQAKRNMIASLRQLAGIVQKYPATTNTLRTELGLTVPHVRQPIPVPGKSPVITVTKVAGNRVELTLREPGSSRKGKPPGVAGLSVFSYIGSAPPADLVDWKAEGQSARTRIAVEFPTSAEPFSQVWITAVYYNAKGQTGAATPPVTTNLGTWLVAKNNGQASPLEGGMRAAA